MRMALRVLVRGAGRSLAVSALLVGGATAIALPAVASGGVSASTFVLHPLVGNSQFASVRGVGYEATLLAAEAKASSGTTSAAPAAGTTLPAWTPVGPQPEQSTAVQTTWGGANSGRVTGLALTPGSSPTIYLAAAGGGVWSSSTGGASWATHTDSQPDIATGSVTVDPSNPSYVFAGTGEANQCLDCFFGDGILESSNGGQSWTTVNPSGVFTGVNIGSIVVEPGATSISSTTVLAGTSQGLFVSTDGGVTWSGEAGTNWPTGTHAVMGVALNTQTSPISIYAYVQGVGLEYSADNGSTWALSMADPAAANSSDFGAVALAPTSSATTTTVYLSVGSGNGYVGLYKSGDGGTTWTALPMCNDGTTTPKTGCVPYFTGDSYGYYGTNNDVGGDQSWYDNTIAVDPQNPNVIVAGGITAVESIDGGTNWTNLNGGGFFAVSSILFHPDFHALAFDSAGNLYMGNDGGIWKMAAANVNPVSGSPVLSYTNLNTNLDITQFYPGFSQNANASTILAGAQDNGTNLYTSPSTTWGEVLGGDGGGTAIDPNNTLNQLAFADGSLYSTTDGWQTAANETYLTPSAVQKYVQYAVNWAPPVAVVPETSGSTIVLGGNGIYLNSSFTNNSGWSGPLGYTGDPSFQGGNDFISTLAYAPSNPQVIYAGWDDGTIEMSTDGGLNWTTIQPEQYNSTTGSYLMVTHIAVDPADPYTIDVAQSADGYVGLAYGGVYAGTGASIEQITATSTSPATVDVTGNLAPGVPSNAVIPDGHGGLLAATDLGVFWAPTLNGASTLWSRVGTGLPNVQVMDIQLTPQGTLIVATHGRGVWTIPFTASSASTATVCTWVGGVGSSGSDWSVGTNWSTTSGASCTQAGGPPSGAQLVFPATPANATVTWDTGTEAGGGGVAPATAYDSIVVEGSGYTFTDSNPGVGVSVSPTLSTPCGSGVGLCVTGTSHVTWPLDVAVSTSQTFAASSGSALSVSGVVSGSADLTVGNATSTGAVSFSAANTLSGTTTVAAGTFTVTGSETSSTVVVSAGSTFYGAGAVSAVQDNGGTVVPASGATSPATLTASHGAPFNWGTLGIVISNAGSSQLSVPAGSVALSGMSLSVNDLPVASPGSSYVLVALGSGVVATGTFSGLAQNATFVSNGKTLQITYPSQYAGNASEGAVITDVTGGTVSTAPTAVTATAGNASAAVSWSAPSSDGGSAITGYTVTATDATNAANSVADACSGSTSSTATSCTATGLTNGDSYTFTVTATNGVGTSSPSSPSNAVTPEATVPGTPTGVAALSGDASAAVSWSAPSSDGGSAITGYTVTATDATNAANSVADACSGSTSSTATSCTATGLTNGDAYTITVAAINAVGTGSASAGVSVTPAGLPAAPGSVVATAGVTSISVTWSAASANGSAIVGYYAVAQSGASAVTSSCSTPLLTCVLSGLTPDVSYTVEVQAINGVGAGPFASSNAVTPYTVPGAPTALSGTAG
ncbi:MAG: beta strand repeat-containing protein, partial [Acidimicrobiales bacterium]